MGYRPSPRPSFDAPTAIRASDAVRHTWGDEEAGFVEDWIYVSSELIHAIVFGLPPGGSVPPLGELQDRVRRRRAAPRPAGDARAREPGDRRGRPRRPGRERLLPARHLAPRLLLRRRPAARARVLRAAPGHGDVGRVRADEAVPRAERLRRDGVVGKLAEATPGPASMRVLRRADSVWRLDRDVLVGLLVSTEHLTVGTVTVPAGHTSLVEAHDGEELLYATRGELRVEAGGVEATLAPGDALPRPAGHAAPLRRDRPRRRRGDLRRGAELRAADGRLSTHSGRQPPCGKAVLGFGWPRMRVQEPSADTQGDSDDGRTR